MLLFGMILNP